MERTDILSNNTHKINELIDSEIIPFYNKDLL